MGGAANRAECQRRIDSLKDQIENYKTHIKSSGVTPSQKANYKKCIEDCKSEIAELKAKMKSLPK